MNETVRDYCAAEKIERTSGPIHRHINRSA
jgi:hypothetical protein